ncbi:hypothetical protein Tco_0709804 [Tanacetum coccineum]
MEGGGDVLVPEFGGYLHRLVLKGITAPVKGDGVIGLTFYNLCEHDEEEETEDDNDPDVIDNVPEIFKIDDDLLNFDSPLLAKARIARMSSNFSAGPCLIIESLVKKKQKGAILELKQRHLKNTIFCTYTPYPAMKIQCINASSAQETRNG